MQVPTAGHRRYLARSRDAATSDGGDAVATLPHAGRCYFRRRDAVATFPHAGRCYFRRRDAVATFPQAGLTSLFGTGDANADDGDDRYDCEEDLPFQTGCGNLCFVLRLSLLGEFEAFDGNGLRIL